MPGAILYAAVIAADLVSGGSVYDRPFPTMRECERAASAVRAELPPPPPGHFFVVSCAPSRTANKEASR